MEKIDNMEEFEELMKSLSRTMDTINKNVETENTIKGEPASVMEDSIYFEELKKELEEYKTSVLIADESKEI